MENLEILKGETSELSMYTLLRLSPGEHKEDIGCRAVDRIFPVFRRLGVIKDHGDKLIRQMSSVLSPQCIAAQMQGERQYTSVVIRDGSRGQNRPHPYNKA